MDSITKNRKTDEQIAVMMKTAVGDKCDVELVHELTNGYFNAVYYVKMSDEKEYALKVAPKKTTRILRHEKNIMCAEVKALRLASEHTDIPVPKVFYYSKDEHADDEEYAVIEWVDGENYNSAFINNSNEENMEVLASMGEMVKNLHGIKGSFFGSLACPEAQFSTWKAAFGNMIKNILADGLDAGVKLPFEYDHLTQLVGEASFCLEEVDTPCLVHGDLWPGNIMVKDNRIVSVLDFERSFYGDPLMEYPFGLLRNNKGFLMGYGEDKYIDYTPTARLRRTLYNLYHHLIVRIERPYRGYENSKEEFFINQRMIGEVKSIEKQLIDFGI